ncbi:MAG: 4-hydroxy-tetrahydrodipicolinate reductase [Alphaproteobacteria bacterium 41-28]|nr:MAG: 4-hydroxy-tetrahydrodipicolinate reductase [Alphaproteobacteria bacterium 41-28]
MLKIAVIGCTGRMGQLVLREINQNPNVDVSGALTRSGSPFVDQDVGTLIGEAPLNIAITDAPEKAFHDADVVIDFSRPETINISLHEILNQQKPYVICVTGLTDNQKASLEKASQKIPVLIAPNTSLGIALLKKLAVLAAEKLGSSYDVSILEMHHRHKSDAPSGTSLSIAQALATVDHLKENAPPYPSRSPRPTNTIECAVLRGGSITGDHSVIFAGEKDVITIEHRTLDRTLFAQGAIKAAQWLFAKPPGLYSMDDVAGISL